MQWPKRLNAPLSEVDPELVDIIEKEKNRQWKARPPLLIPLGYPHRFQLHFDHPARRRIARDRYFLLL